MELSREEWIFEIRVFATRVIQSGQKITAKQVKEKVVTEYSGGMFTNRDLKDIAFHEFTAARKREEFKQVGDGVFQWIRDSNDDNASSSDPRLEPTQAMISLGSSDEEVIRSHRKKGGKFRKIPSHLRRKLNRKIKALYLRHKDHMTPKSFEPLHIYVYQDEETAQTGEILYRVSWKATLEQRGNIYANTPPEYTPLEEEDVNDPDLRRQGIIMIIWQDSAERPINLMGCVRVLKKCFPDKFGNKSAYEIRKILVEEQIHNDGGQEPTDEELRAADEYNLSDFFKKHELEDEGEEDEYEEEEDDEEEDDEWVPEEDEE